MISRIAFGAWLACMSCFVCGCEERAGKVSVQQQPSPAAVDSTVADADNTARNKADLDSQSKTPIDQSNSAAHIKVTADIRRAIMNDESMSVNAQNCKIITDASGTVTLRGPVDSQAEKDAIESKARSIAGTARVVNQLEVKTSGSKD